MGPPPGLAASPLTLALACPYRLQAVLAINCLPLRARACTHPYDSRDTPHITMITAARTLSWADSHTRSHTANRRHWHTRRGPQMPNKKRKSEFEGREGARQASWPGRTGPHQPGPLRPPLHHAARPSRPTRRQLPAQARARPARPGCRARPGWPTSSSSGTASGSARAPGSRAG